MLPPAAVILMKTKTRNHVGAEDILRDLQTLATDTKQLLADNLQAPTAEAISALRGRLEDAQNRMAEYYETAKEKTVAGAKATDSAIRERPYHALAIALGAGVLLGLFLSRRKD